MSYWTLLQVIFDLFVCATIFAIFWRLKRPPQDDPRLSRGLQLLQTKITVLEDLSDRTDAQVKQLTSLIDQKTRLLQNKVIEAEQQIIKIDHSVDKSAAVVQESSLSHGEMLERQRTIEYVKAARMANSGVPIETILEKVSLPREQVELIAKFNRDQLMFDESQLPSWASEGAERESSNGFGLNGIDFVGNLDKPKPDFNQLAKIENNFKQAVEQVKKADEAASQSIMETKMAETLKASFSTGMETVQPAVMAVKATAQTLKDKIVATAEDMLRQQSIAAAKAASASAATTTPSTFATPAPTTNGPTSFKVSPIVNPESTTVKKVIFPRIEKPT